jgi:hypothetical protein
MYKRNIEALSCDHYRVVKTKIVTYSEFVTVALAIQHAKRMRNIVICCLCHILPLSHKLHDFRKALLNMKCLF